MVTAGTTAAVLALKKSPTTIFAPSMLTSFWAASTPCWALPPVSCDPTSVELEVVGQPDVLQRLIDVVDAELGGLAPGLTEGGAVTGQAGQDAVFEVEVEVGRELGRGSAGARLGGGDGRGRDGGRAGEGAGYQADGAQQAEQRTSLQAHVVNPPSGRPPY